MNEFYLLATNDTEASVIASRVIGKRRLNWPGWLIEPIDPGRPRAQRLLLDWWQPRQRLYCVHRHNP